MSRDRGRKQARPGDIFPDPACLRVLCRYLVRQSTCQLHHLSEDGQIDTLHAVEMGIRPLGLSAACVSTVFPQPDAGKSASSSIRLFAAALGRSCQTRQGSLGLPPFPKC
ncbi:hypothetical protein V8C34DRAFT_276814 [Trichoderma compactum]